MAIKNAIPKNKIAEKENHKRSPIQPSHPNILLGRIANIIKNKSIIPIIVNIMYL
jgi:hypothetical protein